MGVTSMRKNYFNLFGRLVFLTIWVLIGYSCERHDERQKEISYQRVRAEKVGKYIADNYADKKILVLTHGDYKDKNGNVVPNHLIEGLKKGLGNVNCEILKRPVPADDTEACYQEIEWNMVYLDNLMQGKNEKGQDIPGYSPVGDFDILITTIDLPEDTIRDGKGTGMLTDKSIAFVYGYIEAWAAGFDNGTIVVAAIDKPYPGESDKADLANWEQYPPSDMDKAFDVRYILKTSARNR